MNENNYCPKCGHKLTTTEELTKKEHETQGDSVDSFDIGWHRTPHMRLYRDGTWGDPVDY